MAGEASAVSSSLHADQILVAQPGGALVRRDHAQAGGVFHNVPELVAAIEDYIRVNNQEPRPFVWTKKEDAILDKIARYKAIIGT